ncbi:MAG: twin-arginine translocase TatA/TatE family subunit [Anaerolineae bacterium]|nr:twin-arginine translocase TatA/TatE family subunit [Anaerolineae bacterium]
MFRLGPLELVIILVIVVLLFGIGRISKVGGELGKGIRAFKEGLSGNKDQESEQKKADEE